MIKVITIRLLQCVLCLCCLFSPVVVSTELYSYYKSNISVEELLSDPEIYECSVETNSQQLCLDDQLYYSIPVDLKFHLTKSRLVSVELSSDLTLHHYVNLQSSLRKDGLSIVKVEIDNYAIDVLAQLKTVSANQVDKDLIFLVNQYPFQFPRKYSFLPNKVLFHCLEKKHILYETCVLSSSLEFRRAIFSTVNGSISIYFSLN